MDQLVLLVLEDPCHLSRPWLQLHLQRPVGLVDQLVLEFLVDLGFLANLLDLADQPFPLVLQDLVVQLVLVRLQFQVNQPDLKLFSLEH